MKKATTTWARFNEAVEALNEELGLAAAVARDHEELMVAAAVPREYSKEFYEDNLLLASVWVSEPRPAAPRGRGERIAVSVSTHWNRPPFGTDDEPLAKLRRLVSRMPGVEGATEPIKERYLLGECWAFEVILRLSQ